ncbi:lipocalin family protein [Sulfitobacter sp. W027]|uniref:lipocalin family protein n=1 Tax=Sulfitobacter sp. W027 TaxID=2867025 RepID=UPI0021A897FE|nr:lipocalin family protein [Sulfitobacter sp. W027]UWR32495.1 lipocalin family protein [Sulfitobacter sp. W027]
MGCSIPWARRAAVLLLLGALAACNRSEPPPVQTGFRNAEALIGATSRFDAARFGGDWQIRAAFPGDANLLAVTFAPQGPTLIETREACDAAGVCTDRRDLWALSEEGPGRYTMRAAVGGAERAFWVLWVDEGFRTAVVGSPEGGYGWILDRQATGGEDRITAAQEILDFNGYDLSALQMRR